MSKAETLAYDLEAEVITRVIADKAAAELRRLAALEKAIMDAEPVAEWVNQEQAFQALVQTSSLLDGTPLYTLNGIKKP